MLSRALVQQGTALLPRLAGALASTSAGTFPGHPASASATAFPPNGTRFVHSTRTEAEAEAEAAARSGAGEAHLELPAGRVPYTSQLRFVGGPDSPAPTIPVYRTIDSSGRDVPDAHVPHPLSQDLALRIYTAMARLQTMDTLFYEAQRQGRFSFYLTCQGEEATNIGSAAALSDKDMVGDWGDGIAGRGPSYGIPAIRVDGGDVQAVYNAVREARARALGLGPGPGLGATSAPAADGNGGEGGASPPVAPGPVLLECMSYRCGHHSTSDDSTRYRTAEEMQSWRSRDPVARFRSWLARRGWWDEGREAELRREVRQQVLAALDSAARQPKPPLSDMFSDVYAAMPPHLAEQREATLAFARRHPALCPPDMPIR
ncbi:hypothetical protein GPECTOR_5g227 [Gonium pectorale]|uniref:Dehydrogenase E1 component domain-containing protein n=1 Tax=Gonium pectorale TaxID=33097 RepID=A0A150GW57_GONPE|nr:hypothetical protein GPECTOR_5g227 [Gonium pectorale]|eukprot:KXZ54126.1 hypothetical protein GPECTOR_5g227 [Gonium pectorale]